MTDAVDRARADLAAGRAWKARDRLTGLLTHRQGTEVLDLLATAYADTGDLPAAGALWFVTGRADGVASDAMRAWRERFGNDEARWQSLPGPVRRGALPPHVAALRVASAAVADQRRRAKRERAASAPADDRLFATVVIGVLLWLLVAIVVGSWTVVAWIVGRGSSWTG